jgi:1,2-diacylglycerol 3-beta-galactosyltransferase
MPQSTPLRRILILTSTSGGGHISAAHAVSEALRDADTRGLLSIDVVDVLLDYGTFPINIFPKLYGAITRRSTFGWKLVWRASNGTRRNRLILSALSRMDFQRTAPMIKNYQPDCIVSVHSIATHLVKQAADRLGWHCPFVVVVTDMVNIHPSWVCPGTQQYFVPTKEAAQRLKGFGVSPSRIKVVGAPVQAKFFDDSVSQRRARLEIGIPARVPTILLLGGAEGTGRIREYVHAINDSDLDVQMIVVAARNSRLKARLEAAGYTKLARVEGFVSNMNLLMRASDVVLTRASPGVVNESLAVGIPVLLTGYLPGQEEGIAELLIKTRIGVYAPRPKDAVNAIARILENGATRPALRKPKNAIARRDSASLIAKYAMDRAMERSPHAEHGLQEIHLNRTGTTR